MEVDLEKTATLLKSRKAARSVAGLRSTSSPNVREAPRIWYEELWLFLLHFEPIYAQEEPVLKAARPLLSLETMSFDVSSTATHSS